MAKKKFDYFEKLEEMAKISQKSAAEIIKILKDFKPDKLPKQLEEIHVLENASDDIKHKIHKNLSRDFLPPIEIEDVVALSESLDDVMDYMEDVLQTLYAYHITEIRGEALEFATLIATCTNSLVKAIHELKNYKKSAELKTHIIEINQFENDGDKIYLDALRNVFTEENDPLTVIKWTKALDYFERCCDAMEDVADIMENVILKNN